MIEGRREVSLEKGAVERGGGLRVLCYEWNKVDGVGVKWGAWD